MGHNKKTIITTGLVAGLGLAAIPALVFAIGISGDVRLDTEITTSIAMKIVSPNDTNPDCMTQSGVTYGVVNRYATSNGAEGSKQVDTFDGTTGGADEVNSNTSCATLTMTPNTFDSTYSDVTVYTNSGTGYAVTLQSAENTSPNLVNITDNTQYIPAGTLTESGNTVPGGQNKWAYKTNNGIITDWTAATTNPVAIKSYDTTTSGGDTTRVTYGISAGSNPTGKYATTLTYTATMFDGLNPYTNYMQDFNADEHASDAVGTEYTVVDSRDRREYAAAKLADGNIWMTEDLKLGGDSAITLTPANSDVTTSFTLAAENTGTWCTENSAACDNQSQMIKTGAPNGYLYNWYAATAGTGTYSTGANQNASASICPKGWKLPTRDQYVALDQAYGGNGTNRTDATQRDKFMAAPLNFNYTGYRSGGSIYNPSDSANYWARTAFSETYAYHLSFDSSGYFYPQNHSEKYVGFAVRCVAEKTTLTDITNMQDMTPTIVANTAVGESKTLTDTRGGSYTVRKLNDGKIWMVQDLKLGGSSSVVLTAENSDFPEDRANWTLDAENTGSWCDNQNATCYDQQFMLKTGVPNGYLYNWYAATAGTGVYDTSAGVNTTASICPKGWKLPTGGASGDFQALDKAYGGTGTDRTDQTQRQKLMNAENNGPAFNWTGWRRGSSIRNPSDFAIYWSRTSASGILAYSLQLSSSDGRVGPQNDSSKYAGFAVRCVAAV